MARVRILYLEPFEVGSHAAFTRTLEDGLPHAFTKVTLPGRHWKWRMRGSAVHAALARAEALAGEYDVVFASSFLPLAELIGLCPRLATVPRVLYFHENQLAYPDRTATERDHHFGVTQMVSALAATRCVFNSAYNRDSFLDGAQRLLARMPDAKPPGWVETIRERACVLPVPLPLPDVPPPLETPSDLAAGPVIAWNHRWEHDKDPEAFFAALRVLHERGVPFRVRVCGERYRDAPAVFAQARAWLGERVVGWGTIDSRADYLDALGTVDIAVSTAQQEFFGLSILEATHLGAYPLVPNRLAYPEHFAAPHLYDDLAQQLERLCRHYAAGERLRADRRHVTRFCLADTILPAYGSLLQQLV